MKTRYFLRCGPGAISVTLLGIGLLIAIIAVQNVRLRRMSDRVDRLPDPDRVILCRASPGQRTYASVGGKNFFFEDRAEIFNRKDRIVVENNGTELRVELNGVIIACQTLQIDLESGRWLKDEPEFFERLGIDFDSGAASTVSAK